MISKNTKDDYEELKFLVSLADGNFAWKNRYLFKISEIRMILKILIISQYNLGYYKKSQLFGKIVSTSYESTNVKRYIITLKSKNWI